MEYMYIIHKLKYMLFNTGADAASHETKVPRVVYYDTQGKTKQSLN